MSLVRVLVTAPVTLDHQFKVDEVLTDAAGPVTVTVKRLDGTPVAGSPFTAGHPGTGTYRVTLPGSLLLDAWTADWAGTFSGSPVSVRDVVEHVGGFLFGLDQVRATPKPPLSAATYTTAELAAKRIEVEQAAERITGVTFVPRYKRYALSGNDRSYLQVPHADLRALRSVRINGTDWSPEQVASVGVRESGVLELIGGWWPYGIRNVIVEIEHGLDMAPGEISTAAMKHHRSLLSGATNSTGTVPVNAISFTSGDGGTYRISTPSRDRIGIPDVDGTYERWGETLGGFA